VTDQRSLPTGVVTFLFTDIEGSTRLLQASAADYPRILEEHARRIRGAISERGGVEVSTEGDAFFAVFTTPTDAIEAAVAAQRALAEPIGPEGPVLRVRMGIHTGRGQLGGDNYVGLDVNRAARIATAGHGGQVLLSDATRALVDRELPPGVGIRDLGEHRLKDLDNPERIYQLAIGGQPDAFPPLRTKRSGNIAPSATSFVGRAAEIAAVSALLDEARVVTLTGPGGAGKTRLALEVARTIGDRFADGAYVVELDLIREPRLLASAVTRALGVPPKDEDVMGALTDWLRDRRLLMVLDNFEQIIAAAPTVAELVRAAPELRVIVTSRTPLRIYGEQEFPVPSLSLPDPAHLPSPERLGQYEAVALFISRARTVRPDFAVTNDNAPAVAALCARLDGLPLAIELAAARTKLLPPDAILRRLSTRLDVLSGGAVNLPERQRTLRGAIAWSYELLDEPAQRLLERVSVFAGGCSLDAAERVCDPDHELGTDILDGLAALVDNSLARQDETHGEPRFSLLETIREYGLERLEERGDGRAVAARHAEWIVALCERFQHDLGFGDDVAYAAIEIEYPNVRAGLRWALDAGEPRLALRIVAAVWRFWQRAGLLEEGRWWADEALALPGAEARTSSRAAALGARGSIAYWAGDHPGTRTAYEESLAIYRELADAQGIAVATFNLAFAEILDDQIDRGRALLTDAVDRFRALGAKAWILEATSSLGYLEMLAGNLDVAEPLLREPLTLTDAGSARLGDVWIQIAQLERLRMNWDAAREAVREGLGVLDRSRDQALSVGAAELRGAFEVEAGNLAWGVRMYAAARALRERTGGGPPAPMMRTDDVLRDARAALGTDTVNRLEAEGQALTDAEVIAMAGAEVESSP
jgi:predicted ATPase/class 3 adenylate cyclase